jgi:hypothetical protein
MFEYLVTSSTRRKLLKLLWDARREGSAADFARWAGVAFAGAHKELQAMEEAGMVETSWLEGKRVYRAAHKHPLASVLKALVQDRGQDLATGSEPSLRFRLAQLGMPVTASGVTTDEAWPLEATLAEACVLAREDASVARAMPVLLDRYRTRLDFDRLERECRARGEKHAMGFFLDLTGVLAGDRALRDTARRFRDHRRRKATPFFRNPATRSKELLQLKTPQLARDWTWLMNMSMDSFRDTFVKSRHGQPFSD